MKKYLEWIFIGGLFFGLACRPSEPPAINTTFVKAEGQVFTDSLGREIIFHGLNMVNKDAKSRYRGKETEADFKRMKSWGMNCVRLGVTWDALEPAPGHYDTTYLQHLDQYIKWAKANGIYVLLDMHQDLYGTKFGNGAPLWATLVDSLPHIAPGAVWSDAYFTSPALKRAFDNFWANKPAPDGVGIQTHLINAWKLVAKRYADEPTVIGFDLMNEPFIGSPIDTVLHTYFQQMAAIYQQEPGQDGFSMESIMQKWNSPSGKHEIMQKLSDTTLFKKVIDPAEPIYGRFERDKLMEYYRKAHRAIRKVNTHHIIFMEPSVSANYGVYSHIQKLTDADSIADPQQAYAPHAYDLVVDTENAGEASFERMKLIYNRLHRKSQELNIPLVVGEWGAFYSAGKEIMPVALFSVEMQEKYKCGDIYWTYGSHLPQLDYFKAINRPYPAYIPGELIEYNYSTKKGIFTIQWSNDKSIDAPLVIYLPTDKFSFLEQGSDKVAYSMEKINTSGKGVWLSVEPALNQVEQTLVMQLKQQYNVY